MKKIAACIAGIFVAVSLTACGPGGAEDDNPEPLYETSIKLSDGREVVCVTYRKGRSAGGPSCDWENAK